MVALHSWVVKVFPRYVLTAELIQPSLLYVNAWINLKIMVVNAQLGVKLSPRNVIVEIIQPTLLYKHGPILS